MDRPRIFLSFFLGILTLQLQVSALNPEADNGYEEWESLRNYSEFQRQSDELRVSATEPYKAEILPNPLDFCDKDRYTSYALKYNGVMIYEGCYDTPSLSAKWTRGKLDPRVKETFARKNYFKVDDSLIYYNTKQQKKQKKVVQQQDMDNYYSLETEKSSFIKRFPNLLEKSFWFTSSCAALVRGHLTPFADMKTEINAEATNRFINVVPQWSELNSGNWLKVEDNIRKWNQQLNTPTPPPKSPTTPPPKPPISFTITTGTSKPITFHEYNTNQFFYLGKIEDKDNIQQNQDIIQVPLFFWKLICYPDNNQKKEMFIFGINFLFDSKLLYGKPATYDDVKKFACTIPIGYKENSILPTTADDPLRGIVFGCLKTNIVDPEIKNHRCL